MSQLRYLRNVTTLALDAERCSGCAMCCRVCPHRVFAIFNGKARIEDRDACMECGACEKNCPTAAISVRNGVGCVTAVIRGALRGTAPDCQCGGDEPCCG